MARSGDGTGSITGGIIGRVTVNLKDAPIDDALTSKLESVACVYQLLRRRGLFLGGTSGINVAAATRPDGSWAGPPRHVLCAIPGQSTSPDCSTVNGWLKKGCWPLH